MSTRKPSEHVTLVVDPAFGEQAKVRAQLGPLWVIASAQNCSVIRELWAAGVHYDANSPTYFDAVPGRSPEDSAIAFIGTVDTHHPSWNTFEIIGVPSSPSLVEALLECAAGVVTEDSATGFVFSRRPTQEEK